jgi:hypothetical protein
MHLFLVIKAPLRSFWFLWKDSMVLQHLMMVIWTLIQYDACAITRSIVVLNRGALGVSKQQLTFGSTLMSFTNGIANGSLQHIEPHREQDKITFLPLKRTATGSSTISTTCVLQAVNTGEGGGSCKNKRDH